MIFEGKTKLLLSKKVFFNPQMKENRDITIQILNEFFKKPFNACDVLAASGAKGIRIANETRAENVVLNDLNPHAIKLMKKNAKLNKLKNIIIESKDANVLLSENKRNFNFIDIDPFGSPAQFIDSACRALLPKNSLLALTATDTGALCGSFQDTALRRYGLRLKRTSFYNELGVRALAAFCIREGAKYDIGLEVVFAHAKKHYLRLYLKSNRGRKNANNTMKKLKFLLYCYKCDRREYSEGLETRKCCSRNMDIIGPLWSGKIYQINIFKEIDTELPYYDLHVLFKKQRKKLKPFNEIMSRIIEKNYAVSRTHFNPYGIKTDMPFKKIISLL